MIVGRRPHSRTHLAVAGCRSSRPPSEPSVWHSQRSCTTPSTAKLSSGGYMAWVMPLAAGCMMYDCTCRATVDAATPDVDKSSAVDALKSLWKVAASVADRIVRRGAGERLWRLMQEDCKPEPRHDNVWYLSLCAWGSAHLTTYHRPCVSCAE